MASRVGSISTCAARALSTHGLSARVACAVGAATDAARQPAIDRQGGSELLHLRSWAHGSGSDPRGCYARYFAAVALSGAAGGSCLALQARSARCEQSQDQGLTGREQANWGHSGGVVFDGDVLLKRFQSDGRGVREAESLIMLSASPEWRPYVPRFFGLKTDTSGERWITMENLIAGMGQPAVLDLKIGTRQYSPDATEKKRRKQLEKAQRTTAASLGLVVVGCTVTGHRAQHEVSAEEMPGILKTYLGTEARVQHARHFAAALLGHFQMQGDYAFFGSSLLFVYDASLGEGAPLRICMVDFCHVHSMDEMREEAEAKALGVTFVPRDFSYIYGLTTLIGFLDGIIFRKPEVEGQPPAA